MKFLYNLMYIFETFILIITTNKIIRKLLIALSFMFRLLSFKAPFYLNLFSV